MHASSRGTEEAAGSPRRADVIATAGELFRLHGYERTTVRELARAVGLQSGSLFHHFRSKEEILVAVMSEGIEEVLEQGALALAHYQDPGRAWRRCSGCICGACSRGRRRRHERAGVRVAQPVAGGSRRGQGVERSLRGHVAGRGGRCVARRAGRRRCARHQALLVGRVEPDRAMVQAAGRLAPGDFIEAMLRAALPGLPPGTGAWPLRD